MRLIGSIHHPAQGTIFSNFLNKQGIDHQIEVQANQDWANDDYGIVECHIWIRDEDQVAEAIKWLGLFKANPQDTIFESQIKTVSDSPALLLDSPLQISDLPHPLKEPLMNQAIPWDKQAIGKITRTLIIICSLLLLLSEMLIPTVNSGIDAKQVALFISPVNKSLLYDYPYHYELIDQYLQLNENDTAKPDLPATTQNLLKEINETPSWQGIYSLLIAKSTSEQQTTQTPTLFEKIREGQIWRLFSPALLHGDIFHLFFNMLWFVVLGKQIEQRLTTSKYLFFLLLLGIFSNTMQYLATGPNFVGFSGILCGMLTFMWEREKIAPWEGYELNRMTYLFMMVFIYGMASIQLFSFFMEKSFNMNFSPNVANTAHLSGALLGYIMGKTTLFSWRQS